jgi:hypothetical protein
MRDLQANDMVGPLRVSRMKFVMDLLISFIVGADEKKACFVCLDFEFI